MALQGRAMAETTRRGRRPRMQRACPGAEDRPDDVDGQLLFSEVTDAGNDGSA